MDGAFTREPIRDGHQEKQAGYQKGRESAASILRRRATALHEEAVGLTKLANHMEFMPAEVDEAIWRLIVKKL